jgi:hypothetical protein
MTESSVPATHLAASGDRRVLSLLESYAALSGGNLTMLEPDLYQLSVPAGDEARFGGRSVVRVAFTVDALELDDRAVMAIVGSSFVNELIDAIRGRGSRRFAGWVVPSVSASAVRPPPPVPVRNAAIDETQSSLARHRVGRLTARVAIRAGTELRERLADSSLYDLCSGISLSDDVAAACERPASAETTKDWVESTASAPIQRVAALVEKMLGDLEARLLPEIEEVAEIAKRSMADELARIERYYAAMLYDLGVTASELGASDWSYLRDIARSSGQPTIVDTINHLESCQNERLDSVRPILGEYQRRADEERDRHRVRAVVHPVQLTEWELVVQRSTWSVETPSGRRASFTSQRPLAGQSVWTFACETCGTRSPTGLHVCRHDHMACDACASTCSVCLEAFCRDHGTATCHVDGAPACDAHATTCRICHRIHCSAHETICDDGNHSACTTCVGACAICGRSVCDSHASFSRPDAPRGQRRFCHACARTCEGGTGEVVGPDEVVQCATCDRVVCENHQSCCAVDGKVQCSRHLRRTDRSRRLVCEHDRAACIDERNAVFAVDEVFPCTTCGRTACEQHLATCVVDGRRYCADHIEPVDDRLGTFACDMHRSECHVDGRLYSTNATRECPCCGRQACVQHTRDCERCRRSVCTADFSRAEPTFCATCVKLGPGKPDDELIAAVVELRGLDAPSPKGWKVARDARHLIAELDLGWTRRLTIAVPHGESRAERAVAHSMLRSRVVR